MYCIQNKRGIIHKGHISPNKIDASLLLAQSKWILAELIRLKSNMKFEETIDLVNQIISKETELVWIIGEKTRLMDTSLSYTNQVLCLLYIKGTMTEKELLESTESSNPAYFNKLLKKSHKLRLIEYDNNKCSISPKGEMYVEELLSKR